MHALHALRPVLGRTSLHDRQQESHLSYEVFVSIITGVHSELKGDVDTARCHAMSTRDLRCTWPCTLT